MPYPKDLKELCDRLRPYHDDLGHWLRRRQMEIDDLLGKAGLPNHYPPEGVARPIGKDPPPPPPDLGP